MELKEIVNLRKLYEEFFDTDLTCDECPFRDICGMHQKSDYCFVGQMVGDQRDLYDLEREKLDENEISAD